MGRSRRTPQTESQCLYRGFNWVQSRILSRWSQQHRALSRLCPWRRLSLWKLWAECTLQGQRRGAEPPISRVQLEDQPAVTSSPSPPPTYANTKMSFYFTIIIFSFRKKITSGIAYLNCPLIYQIFLRSTSDCLKSQYLCQRIKALHLGFKMSFKRVVQSFWLSGIIISFMECLLHGSRYVLRFTSFCSTLNNTKRQ